MKKLITFTLLLALLMSSVHLGFATGDVLQPFELKTNVYIHKIIQTKENFNAKDDQGNDIFPGIKGIDGRTYQGEMIGLLSDFFGSGTVERADVEFNYYKIDGVSSLDALTGEQILAKTEAEIKEALNVDVPTGTILSGASEDTVLDQGRYIMFEVRPDDLIDGKAAPIFIELPIAKLDGSGYLEDLHLYPKNLKETPPSIKKGIDTLETNLVTKMLGEEFTYHLQVDIPEGIYNAQLYKIEDKLHDALDFVANSITVSYADGSAVSADLYSATYEYQKVSISFIENNFKAGQGLDSSKGPLRISFKAKLNGLSSDVIMGTGVKNTATVFYTNKNGSVTEETSNPVHVKAGGAKFIKKADGLGVVIEDAYFVLKDNGEPVKWTTEFIRTTGFLANQGMFGYIDPTNEGKYIMMQPNTPTEYILGKNVVLRSNSEGIFQILGLDYTTKDATEDAGHRYTIEEVQAPGGYSKLTDPIEFTVDENSNTTEIAITNSPIPRIPATGGIGSLIFILLGLLIMGGSFIVYKKRNKEAN